MSRNIMDLQPVMVEKCLRFIQEAQKLGIKVKVISTSRDMEEHMALYAKGRTRPGEPCHHLMWPHVRPVGTCKKHPLGAPVTWATWGQSPHDHGLAFDVCFTTNGRDAFWDGPWNTLGSIASQLGLEWGGMFPSGKTDEPHFQLAKWRSQIGVL
jgi:hypothetical protein